jgi:hypothetical protein
MPALKTPTTLPTDRQSLLIDLFNAALLAGAAIASGSAMTQPAATTTDQRTRNMPETMGLDAARFIVVDGAGRSEVGFKWAHRCHRGTADSALRTIPEIETASRAQNQDR